MVRTAEQYELVQPAACSRATRLVANGLRRGPCAVPALDGDNLEVQLAEVQADVRPGGEVVLDGDGAAGATATADRDVLVESGGALDGRLVDALILPDFVRAAVASERALLRARLREAGRVLNHVILHQRIGRPAVNGQRAKAAGDLEAAAIGDGSVKD